MQLPDTFRAFRSRNYSLFFAGQSFSLVGTWMQKTAVSWIVYDTTKSTAMLGLSVFASQFPSFIFSILGGTVADRYDRYKVLLFTQIFSMIQAIVMTVLVMSGNCSVWTILALSVVLGIINAFDVPARQPLVNQLISDKNDLPNAVALNSSMVNFARLAAPALAGIILNRFGAGICFLLNSLSFVAVLTSLFLLKLAPYHKVSHPKNATAETKEGFVYLRQTPVLLGTMVLLTIMSAMVLSYDALIAVFAKDIFHGTAETYGYIRSFIGLGAISSTLFLASRKAETDLKKVLFVNIIILGISMIAFSFIKNFHAAMIFAVLMGFGTMSQSTIYVTIIQVNSDEKMRGRMISYLAMGMFGMMPLGSLLCGYISKYAGATNVMTAQGLLALLIVFSFTGFLLGKKNKME